MTLDILKAFGIEITHDDYKLFRIKGGQQPHTASYDVEGDWSGAAFHLVGAAISGELTVEGLNPHSAQADRAILEALKQVGADIYINHNSITVKKKTLKAFVFDATHCPDLFPPLAALAACCEGESVIIGINRLYNKESNRALSIQSELNRLGVNVELRDNAMYIRGASIKGAVISSHHDHRIAMMGAILALVADSDIIIKDHNAVEKSYPQFYEHFLDSRNYELLRNTI